MPTALDFSTQPWPKILGTHLGVIRYIGRPGHDKNLTRAELVWRIEHRQPVALVYEESAGWMLGGYEAGRAAAWAILADWHDNLGMTVADLAIVFAAADKDMTAANLPALDECLRGMGDVLHPQRVGIYGEAMVVTHCVGQSRRARLGWQTRAWSGTEVTGFACLYQTGQQVTVDGTVCDLNQVLKADWGQLALPPPPKGDLDMANSPAELTAAAAAAFRQGVLLRWDPDPDGDGPGRLPYTIREMLVTFPMLVDMVKELRTTVTELTTALQTTRRINADTPDS